MVEHRTSKSYEIFGTTKTLSNLNSFLRPDGTFLN